MNPAGKYTFGLLSFLMLLFFVVISWDAPVSGDEYVHYVQAKKNILFYKTLGKDQSAFETPVSHLKLYGQSFDNLTTLLEETFDIHNIIRFRHVSNAVAAWLLVLFTGLLAAWIIGDKRAGILAMILLAASPRFTGHAMNNLKDIPFALGYTASLYFIFRILDNIKKNRILLVTGLLLSMAFTISIRIGGVLVLCYLWLFAALRIYQKILQGELKGHTKNFLISSVAGLLAVTLFTWFLGIAFWPWALANPFNHPLEALIKIHHYPTTLRQVFEGKLYWSEMFPWYYLPKYILITIPLTVLAGLMAYIAGAAYFLKNERFVYHIFLIVAAGFPVVYTIMTGANVYGGWRQLLFVYPPLVILSAAGMFEVMRKLKSAWMRGIFTIILVLPGLLPLGYLATGYPYYYMYFNPLAGGIRGAYGNYELDYYFTGFKAAYEWIDRHVQNERSPARVATNFLIPWYYEFSPAAIKPVYFDYYMRGNFDWDYAVVPSTFLSPFQLKEHFWPPENTVYRVEVRGVPVCAVIQRRQREDLEGYKALRRGQYDRARDHFLKALAVEPHNETALLNLARVYFYERAYAESKEVLNRLLDIYPRYEWALDLFGEIHFAEGDLKGAVKLWEDNLSYNFKFLHSYINLSKAFMAMGRDDRALSVLFDCLRINPFYKPVLTAIGNWYKTHGKEHVARKYLDRASNMTE